MVAVNYLAILLCGVAAMVLGFLWYGPLFGKVWMKEAGMSPDMMDKAKHDPAAKRAMMRSYAIMFLSSLVMAYILSHVLVFATSYMGTSGVMAGLSSAFWMWLGFIATTSIGSVLWEMKTWKYWMIVAGYYLVDLSIMSMILSYWM